MVLVTPRIGTRLPAQGLMSSPNWSSQMRACIKCKQIENPTWNYAYLHAPHPQLWKLQATRLFCGLHVNLRQSMSCPKVILHVSQTSHMLGDTLQWDDLCNYYFVSEHAKCDLRLVSDAKIPTHAQSLLYLSCIVRARQHPLFLTLGW